MAIKKCICPICLDNEMEKGLMCPGCYQRHKDVSVQAIRKHQAPESKLQFAIRRTSENLTLLGEELNEKMSQTRPFFSKAHSEISSECRMAELNLPKDKFMELVKERYHEILNKAGQKELYERVEWLKTIIRGCEKKFKWYESLSHRQKNAENQEVINVEAEVTA